MDRFVGSLLHECMYELLSECGEKPLQILQSTSRKVLGTHEIRILRIQETDSVYICLVGVY